MLTFLSFMVTLGILVTVHEYGHFQMARWCGVKVLKFSVGFGKPLWSKKFGQDQTEFVIAAIPLGGYVKMLGEELSQDTSESANQDMSRALNRQSVGKRMAIVLAGPMANLLLAIVLYWALFMMGVVGMKPLIGDVIENSPSALASIGTGEMIQKVNGKDVATWQDVRWLLIKESFATKKLEIQTIDHKGEDHLHSLDISQINFDDADQDVLDKLGLTIYQPKIPAKVGEVIKNSPADAAGLKADDLVLSINQVKVNDWEGFVKEIKLNPNRTINILVLRDENEVLISAKPEAVLENGKTIGRIGAAFKIEQNELNKYFFTTHYSMFGALSAAIAKTWDTAVFTLKMIGKMVMGDVSWKGVSGPVTIASYAGQSASMGIKVFVGFLALVSISIGVLNLLPIPILDGGHFMYYMVEFFTGKPVSDSVLNIGQKLGFFLLGCMMILALYNDMNRLITG